MKNTIIVLLSLLNIMGITSCEQYENTSATSEKSISSTNISNRSVTPHTCFVNTETGIDEVTGNVWATGELQCTERTEYTFTFAFNGTTDVVYEAQVGSNLKLIPSNGSNFRTFTTTLEPGTHKCYVQLFFGTIPSNGELRLVITHINGSTASSASGYSDLSVSGSSRVHENPSLEEPIWTCSNCKSLNSSIRTKCISCGTEKPTF